MKAYTEGEIMDTEKRSKGNESDNELDRFRREVVDTIKDENLKDAMNKVLEWIESEDTDCDCGCGCDCGCTVSSERITRTKEGRGIKMTSTSTDIPTEFRDEILEDHPELLFTGPVTVDGIRSGYSEELGLLIVQSLLSAPTDDIKALRKFVKANLAFANMIANTALEISTTYADRLQKDPYFISSLVAVYSQFASAMNERAMCLKAYLIMEEQK